MHTILQITPYYPPHLGGMERVAESLASALGDQHHVRVLTTTIGAGDAPRRSLRGNTTIRRHRSIELAHTPLSPGLLVSLLRQPRSAIIHLHAAQAILPEFVALMAKVRRQRFVVHFHLDVDASGRMGWLLPAYKRHVFGRALRTASAVIVLTRAQADFVHATYAVPMHRLFVVPNGVNPSYFMPVRPLTGRRLELLYVGRLSPQKNVGRLLEAMSLLGEPVGLRVIGDGELRDRLEAQAASLRLSNVVFAGPKDGPDLARAYADADALVLPSDKEGMSLVALEAMAAALPIIATDVPGNAELVGGVGLLSAPEPDALAAVIDSVASDPGLRRLLGQRSAAAARAYSWDRVAHLVEDVYAEALS